MYKQIKDKQYKKMKNSRAKQASIDAGAGIRIKKRRIKTSMIRTNSKPPTTDKELTKKISQSKEREGEKQSIIPALYQKKYGNLEKFISGNSSIDRFCRLYYRESRLDNMNQDLGAISNGNSAMKISNRALSAQRPRTNEFQGHKWFTKDSPCKGSTGNFFASPERDMGNIDQRSAAADTYYNNRTQFTGDDRSIMIHNQLHCECP